MCETTSSSRPRALISRSALAAAASAAVSGGGRIADLRRDAWGHGLLAIAQAAAAGGVAEMLVDSPHEVQMLALEGIEGVRHRAADIDPRVLYGLPDDDGALLTAPILRLVGRVLSTKPLEPGDAVSYGYTYRATRRTRVALVTGGYAQGIVRSLGNKASVEIRGASHPIIGRVAMDVCVVEIGDAPVELDDEVTYFGGTGAAAPWLASWAAVTGMTPAELVTVAAAHAVRGWEA